jgi:hypothetical protein
MRQFILWMINDCSQFAPDFSYLTISGWGNIRFISFIIFKDGQVLKSLLFTHFFILVFGTLLNNFQRNKPKQLLQLKELVVDETLWKILFLLFVSPGEVISVIPLIISALSGFPDNCKDCFVTKVTVLKVPLYQRLYSLQFDSITSFVESFLACSLLELVDGRVQRRFSRRGRVVRPPPAEKPNRQKTGQQNETLKTWFYVLKET